MVPPSCASDIAMASEFQNQRGMRQMAEIVGYPLDGGGMLLVQSASVDVGQDELGLASAVEEKVKKANETLESALDQVTPALKSVAGKLRDLSPDDLTVEFGLTMTA